MVPSKAVSRERRRAARNAAIVAATFLAAACSDPTSTVGSGALPVHAASADRATDAAASDRTTSVHWNEVARSLVASHNTNGPLAARVYALVSVAQLRAVLALGHGDLGDDAHGSDGDRGTAVDAAVARASANVLAGLYIDAATAARIEAELALDQQTVRGDHGSAVRGDEIGAAVAEAILTRAATDGASAANCPATPPAPASEFWHDDAVPPNPQPLLPCFGRVRTWLGIDVTQFRAGPPPAFGSAAYLAGLAEVRQISDTRTAAQLAIVDTWLDGANTQTPPGHWNSIASD